MPLILIGSGVVAGLVLVRVLEGSTVMVGQRWARRLAAAWRPRWSGSWAGR